MGAFTIDRFEGAWAVLEDREGRTFNVPRDWLPSEVREGDLVTVARQAAAGVHLLRFEIDAYGREQRLSDATRRRQALPHGPKGHLAL